MKIKYKISYLTNGTKVKITSQLFKQINQWGDEGIKLSPSFLDELKIQDNDWINRNRQYYRYTTSIQSLSQKAINKDKSLIIEGIEKKADTRLIVIGVLKKLNSCTSKQRRRFLLFYYYGYSYSEIAEIEGKSKYSIRNSVQKALEILTNNELFKK